MLRLIHHLEGYDHQLSTEALKMIYEGLVPGSKLRKFVIHQFRYGSDITSPDEHKVEDVDEIAEDCLLSFAEDEDVSYFDPCFLEMFAMSPWCLKVDYLLNPEFSVDFQWVQLFEILLLH